ncbi:MAG: ADP-ribosylglycohydrolase family protein [Armatimonadota bacterium]|nr:ADP-ribosylglycohydrolase family protein [bacterium]
MKRLQYGSYCDKVLGGWLGKCVGGSLGAPTEGIKASNNVKFYTSCDKAQIANDDLDIQLVWIHALKQRGVEITASDLMEEWVEHVTFPWSEYGYALRNFRTGIHPPESGRFNNSFYGESMGCPIRSEIWGMICPGNPELAADYAENDASLDHFGNSIHAERFLAAIEAAAFVENDICKLLDIGLSVIPADSRLAQCINYITECFNNRIPLVEARGLMLNRFGHPDFTSSLQNLGFIVIGLLYGMGDFEKSLLSAVNCGFDTDCTGATVGAILGITLGASSLPKKWVDPIGNKIISLLDINALLDEPTINCLSRETCEIGMAVSMAGKTDWLIDNAPEVLVIAADGILDKPKREISIDVEYLGMSSISFSDSGNARLFVRNHTGHDIKGTLELFVPEIMVSSFTKVDFFVQAMGVFQIDVKVSLKSGVMQLPVVNRIKHICTYDGKSSEGWFGFSGASQWLVMGPFWEPLPNSAIKTCRYIAHQSLSLPPYEVMVLNTAYLDKEYIPEPVQGWDRDNLPPHTPHLERVVINSHEDKVDLDNIFTLQGPQTLYLYREIDSPQERKAWIVIGANDGIKVWINGVECLSSIDRMYTFPGHHSAEVKLNQGVNTILVKVVRSGANFDYSFALKEHNDQHWHKEQHLVDYSNIRLSDLKNDTPELDGKLIKEISVLEVSEITHK